MLIDSTDPSAIAKPNARLIKLLIRAHRFHATLIGSPGVPFAALLAVVAFVLCIAQLGPALVLAPSVAWLYWQGATGAATALLLWTLVVVTLDNVLRPILMTKGANLPMLLMFAGVLGGLLAFGLIGIFVGPVVLAVSYTLLVAWIGQRPDALLKSEVP